MLLSSVGALDSC